ncbi:hypothetical protein JB92DRAFT_3106002 [Gautieria morchelliformis]|nr:hypothetical protein JB92DRAFT_3106002 [Gautieria morchelliformis]
MSLYFQAVHGTFGSIGMVYKLDTALVPVPDALAALNIEHTSAVLTCRTTAMYCPPLFRRALGPSFHGDLGQQKANFENEVRSGRRPEEIPKEIGWTTTEGRALEEETGRARQGLAFLCLKAEG